MSDRKLALVAELPDDLRDPLYSLQADIDYLVARIHSEDDEVAGMMKDSIKTRLGQIEEAAYRIATTVRAEALEEAAQECELYSTAKIVRSCAEIIRALKEKP